MAEVGSTHFSIVQALFFAPKHFTELVIYGRSGIDKRARLLLWDSLKAKGLRDQELTNALLAVLPLNFGEKFILLGNFITILLGIAFIVLANDSVRESV